MNPQHPSPEQQYRVVMPPPRLPGQLLQVPPDVEPVRRRGLLVVGAIVVLVALLGLAVALFRGPVERPMQVKLGLFDIEGGSDCSGGDGGYNDIGPGMPVTVRDESGTIIGSGSLPSTGEEQEGLGCIWTTMVMVPDDARQYAVEGGDRGAVTYSRSELEDNNWTAELSIGP